MIFTISLETFFTEQVQRSELIISFIRLINYIKIHPFGFAPYTFKEFAKYSEVAIAISCSEFHL
jgi:hypothetical protein